MAVISTGSIAERTNISTYIFFSLINSCFIFPVGLAWCWNDGWLQNIGYIDIGGAGIVHVMGGIAGFMGTMIIGPRVGLFQKDRVLAYLLEDGVELDFKTQPKEEEKFEYLQQPPSKFKQERDLSQISMDDVAAPLLDDSNVKLMSTLK